MAILDMEGSYDLESSAIDKAVTQKSPGNYALGYVDNEGTFFIKYVGRDDKDVKTRLKSWVGKKAKYKKFKFSFATSPKDAFKKECKNYHDCGGKEKLDNEIHPARPDGTDWECPICTIFD